MDQDGSVKIFNLPNSVHSTICHRTLYQVPEDQSYWGLGFCRAEIAILIKSSRDLSYLKITLRLYRDTPKKNFVESRVSSNILLFHVTYIQSVSKYLFRYWLQAWLFLVLFFT